MMSVLMVQYIRAGKKKKTELQWASKFQFSLAPTKKLLADMVASMEIRR